MHTYIHTHLHTQYECMPNTEVKKAAVKNGKEEVGANDEPSGDDDDEKRE